MDTDLDKILKPNTVILCIVKSEWQLNELGLVEQVYTLSVLCPSALCWLYYLLLPSVFIIVSFHII